MLPTLRPGALTDLPPTLLRQRTFLPEGSDLSHLLLGSVHLRNDGDGPADLPLLPTAVPRALCVCPTARYEGFFLVKLRKKKK